MIRKNLKKVIEKTQIPKELITNCPKITIISNEEIQIENHKGIIKYDSSVFSINTRQFPIIIYGQNMYIQYINNDVIVVKGKIKKVELDYNEVINL